MIPMTDLVPLFGFTQRINKALITVELLPTLY